MQETNLDKKTVIAEINSWITEQAKFVQTLDSESANEYYKRLDEEIEKKRRLLPVVAGILQKKHGVSAKSAWAMPSEEARRNYKVTPAKTENKEKKAKSEKNRSSDILSKRGKSEEDKLAIDFYKVFRPMCNSDDDGWKMAKAEVTKLLQKQG